MRSLVPTSVHLHTHVQQASRPVRASGRRLSRISPALSPPGLKAAAFGAVRDEGDRGAVHAGLALELAGSWLTFDGRARQAIADRGVSRDLNARLPPDW